MSLAYLTEDMFASLTEGGGITPLLIIGAIIIGVVMYMFAKAQEAEYRRTHCSHGMTGGHTVVSGMTAKWCEGPRD